LAPYHSFLRRDCAEGGGSQSCAVAAAARGRNPANTPCDLPPNLMRCAGQPPASALKGKEFPAETRTSARTPRNCSTSELPSGTSYVGRTPRYLTARLTWRNANYAGSSTNTKRPVPHHREDSMGRARRLSYGPTNSRET